MAQKKAASVTLRPLYYPKAIQEQQTQNQSTTGGCIAQVISLVVLEEAREEVTGNWYRREGSCVYREGHPLAAGMR